MKIAKLQLNNIGVFNGTTFDFSDVRPKDCAEIHIFTGENGSGKSTVLYALAGLLSAENSHYSGNQSLEQLRKRFHFFNENVFA